MRYNFLRTVRRKGIDPRKIDYKHIFVVTAYAFFAFNSNAYAVADIIITACEFVEKSCFSAIRIADKSNDCFCIGHSFHHLVNKNFFGVLFSYTYVTVEYTKFDRIAERC